MWEVEWANERKRATDGDAKPIQKKISKNTNTNKNENKAKKKEAAESTRTKISKI